MGFSAKAIWNTLVSDLDTFSIDAERFKPLLDLSVSLFHSDRAVLMISTPGDPFEFHSSHYLDAQTESGLERMGRVLIKEWAKQPFLLFTPESVAPEFLGGLLNKRPFRQRPFVCLMLVEKDQVLGVFYLEGTRVAESLREVGARNLDILQRLCSYYIRSDTQYRKLAQYNQALLAHLERAGLEELEKEGIRLALERNRGNISKTHVELGIPRMSFYHKLRRYRIKPQIYRPGSE